MRRLHMLVLAVVALLAFATAFVGSASAALPKNLPEKAREYTGVAGETKFEAESPTVVKVECKKATGTGAETATEASGKIHIEFKECEGTIGIVKSKCTGLGDTTAGVILVLGTGSLVFDKLSTNPAELKTAELFKLEPVHFECSSGAVLILVTGTELCLHLNPTQLSTKHEFHCVQEKGLNKEDAGWYNNAGELQTFGLKQSVNGATATPAAELGLSVVTTTEAVEAMQ